MLSIVQIRNVNVSHKTIYVVAGPTPLSQHHSLLLCGDAGLQSLDSKSWRIVITVKILEGRGTASHGPLLGQVILTMVTCTSCTDPEENLVLGT